jgi:hypothetical protein
MNVQNYIKKIILYEENRDINNQILDNYIFF